MDIVLADVPEGRLNRVKVGQGCQATFFGIPNQRFSGKVTSIAPVLSKERRSLRVLFVINDPDDKLRPGMFAEIGLGTDPRDAILATADGVLHIGRADYVLTAAEDMNTWRVTEVQVGEPHGGEVEILDGLKDGERIIGKGAILFKPLVIRSLQSSALPAPEVHR
jgi:multidrug efflux pump subunit AcrA (membrane-fusion protein)